MPSREGAQPSRLRLLSLSIFAALQTSLAWLLLPFACLLRKPSTPSESPRRILIVSLGGIGDNVFVVPVFRALRRKYPAHHITLIVRPSVRGFRQLLPAAIDEELAYSPGRSALARLFEPLRALRFLSAHDLLHDTELALLPRWDWDSWGAVFLAFFSRARRRLTFSEHVNREKHARNWLHDSLFTELAFATTTQHESDHIKQLVAEAEQVEVEAVAGSLRSGPKLLSGDLVVIGPFAAIDRRTWSLNGWPSAVQALTQEDPGLRFLIVGSEADRPAAAALAQTLPACEVRCGLPLDALVSLLAEARLFVGMDSGLAHLAGAAGTPVVQICCHPLTASPAHNNSPTRFAALSPRTIILQPTPNRGCENACLQTFACCINNVSPAEVTAAIRGQLLAARTASEPFRYAHKSSR